MTELILRSQDIKRLHCLLFHLGKYVSSQVATLYDFCVHNMIRHKMPLIALCMHLREMIDMFPDWQKL